ncbi:HVO_2523 family zinc finger protein [Natronorubrum bangense]|nr:HVO_2523 family zinc finger protein [Natronorubrum bangense]
MTDSPKSHRTDGHPCPFCETPMYKRHCKYVCPQHGVVIDCSDPFL